MALHNLSIEEFKAEMKVSNIQIVRSPKTSKLFASAGGENYRVQGKEAKSGNELDIEQPISYMWDDERNDEGKTPIQSGCFVNSNADNLITTL